MGILNIKYLFISALLTRILLSFLPAFEYDQSAFRFWSIKLAEQSLTNFYFSDFFTSNPVGFLYILWLIGLIVINFAPIIANNPPVFDLLLKLPANLADLLTGLFVYHLIKQSVGIKWAVSGFLLYVFNPAIFFNSAIWGQYDAIPTLLLLTTIYLLTQIKQSELALASLAVAWTLKPQTIAFGPIVLTLLIRSMLPLKWLTSTATFLATVLLIYLPFFPNNPLYGLIYVNQGSATLFDCTTCFALNFWGIFGNWQSDLQLFLGLPLLFWGIILYLLVLSLVLLTPSWKIKFQPPYLYLTTAVSLLTFFTFLTRMHERYLSPFFVFMLLAAVMLKSRLLITLYLAMSIIHLINLYLPYTYYNQNLTPNNPLFDILMNSFQLLSAAVVILAFIISVVFIKITRHAQNTQT